MSVNLCENSWPEFTAGWKVSLSPCTTGLPGTSRALGLGVETETKEPSPRNAVGVCVEKKSGSPGSDGSAGQCSRPPPKTC